MSVSIYHDTMTIPIVRCPEVVMNSNISGYSSMEDQDTSENSFKSEFAKQLEQKLVSPGGNYEESSSYSQLYHQTEELRRAKEEFRRIKQENSRLKSEIEKKKQDEERYVKLQYEVEHLTTRLHKMEENRQAYEDLTEQLGSYISIFSSQLSLTNTAEARDLSRSCTLPRPMSLYQHSSTLPRQLYHQESLSTRKPYYEQNSKSLPRQRHVHIQESSLESASDGESGQNSRGFLSLPRRNRGKHQDRFRVRSRTMTNPKKKRISPEDCLYEEEDAINTIEISCDGVKKKKGLDVFLTKLKMFLLKKSKYDMQVQTLV